MKEIMAKESSSFVCEVPSYEYDPISSRDTEQLFLFDQLNPIKNLKNDLMSVFSGRDILLTELFEEHSVGKVYLLKNYKRALLELENEHFIAVKRPSVGSKLNTIADKSIISFK